MVSPPALVTGYVRLEKRVPKSVAKRCLYSPLERMSREAITANASLPTRNLSSKVARILPRLSAMFSAPRPE